MKNLLKITLSLLFIAASFISCVDDKDFDTPQVDCNDTNYNSIPEGNILTIDAVKNIWSAQNTGSGDENIVDFSTSETVINYIKGFIVSSDINGNFYKELYIQDAKENPTSAIKLDVDYRGLYAKFPFGSEVIIRLNGLAINKSHGELVIGKNVENAISSITDKVINDFIIRSCNIEEISAKQVTIDQINNSLLSTFIQLDDVQFVEVGVAYTNPEDSFDSHRTIISCTDGKVIKLETSSFAGFKDTPLPTGKGTIKGILSRDYRDDFYVLKLNSLDDVNFNDTRCGGVELTPNVTLSNFMSSASGDLGLTDDVIEAYVISNDSAGNFYKTIYVQDKIINPTVGLQILVDERDMFKKFPVGGKVYIKPGGLYFGESYGVLSLGFKDGDYVGRIDEGRIDEFLVYSGEQFDITPSNTSMDGDGNVVLLDINGLITTNLAPKSTLIKLHNMEVPYSDLGSAYTYFNGSDSVNKLIYNCDSEKTIIMRNSGFATFANDQFPTDKGDITCVLSSYFDDNQIYIRDTYDVNLTDTDRCEKILDCGLADAEGTNDLLVENFDSGIPATWTNYIQEGTKNWVDFSGSSAYSGKSVKMGSYNSGDASSIAWLISPMIDMDAQDGETLEFKSSNSFADGSKLDLLYSNDWDGTTAGVATASWSILASGIIVDDDEYYQNWVSSGNIDLSCAEGATGYIAFKYTGSGNSDFDGTYELDDFKLKF